MANMSRNKNKNTISYKELYKYKVYKDFYFFQKQKIYIPIFFRNNTETLKQTVDSTCSTNITFS